MKRWLPTLVALVLLAGLGVYVGLYETEPKPDDHRERVDRVEQDDIVRVALEDGATGVTTELERRAGGTWWITAPTELEAESDAIDLLLRHLADPQVERKMALPDQLAPFKLDDPPFKATIELKDGTRRTLLVGDKNPTGSAYFVKAGDGESLFTIASYSVDHMRKSAGDLRNKTLLAFEPADVTRIVIARGRNDVVELIRQDEDAWRLARPVKAPADRFGVDGLLNDLKGLKGTEIIEEPHAYSKYKLDQPAAVVTLHTGGGGTHELTLAKPDDGQDEAYASSTRAPFVLKLAGAHVVAAATKPVKEFRERLLVSVDREDLAEIRVTAPDLTLVARRSGDDWTIVEPAGAKAADELDDLLFETVYVRAEEFAADAPRDPARFGLSEPRAVVTLKGSKEGAGPFEHTYRLGALAGDRLYLQVEGSDAVVEVRRELLEKVSLLLERVRAGPDDAPEARPEPASPS